MIYWKYLVIKVQVNVYYTCNINFLVYMTFFFFFTNVIKEVCNSVEFAK